VVVGGGGCGGEEQGDEQEEGDGEVEHRSSHGSRRGEADGVAKGCGSPDTVPLLLTWEHLLPKCLRILGRQVDQCDGNAPPWLWYFPFWRENYQIFVDALAVSPAPTSSYVLCFCVRLQPCLCYAAYTCSSWT
jgi:hypothetical protein